MKRGPEICTTTRLKIQMNLCTTMEDLKFGGQFESCSTSTDHAALLLQRANTDEYVSRLAISLEKPVQPF
jgi:hypothetical protein